MAESKKIPNEREYVIPLRKSWMKTERYKRTRKSVMEIKKFIAKHMKVPERDERSVKLDVYLNNELWFRGAKKPPAKIKVKAKREGGFVKVELADAPDVVKFKKTRHEKLHKKAEKKKITPKPEETEKKEKAEEEKKAEAEKEKSVEKLQEKIAEQSVKAQKHTIKEKTPEVHRKALKK